jgi:hypothetical protein
MQDRPKPRYQRTVTTYTYLPLVRALAGGRWQERPQALQQPGLLDQP